MSTKIYDGLRVVEGVDVFDVNAALRTALDPVRNRLDADLFTRLAVAKIDDTDIAGQDRPGSVTTNVVLDYVDEQHETSSTHHGYDPHRFTMSLGRDPGTGRVLAIPFYDERAYGDALDATGLFEDYGYWDNSDMPKEETTKSWDSRRLAWKGAMPGWAPPIRSMLTFELRESSPSVGAMFLMRDRPDLIADALTQVRLEDRAYRVARSLCINAVLRHELATGVERDVKTSPIEWTGTTSNRTQLQVALAAEVQDAVADVLTPLVPEDLNAGEPVNAGLDTSKVDEAVTNWLNMQKP